MASGDELAPFVLTNVEGLHDSSQEREKGSGAYGVVYKVSVNGMPCIAKRLHAILTREVSRQEKDSVQAKFRNECIMLSKLQHPNIVHFVGVCYGNSVEELSLIMECLHTDLDQYLETQPNIPLPDKLSILLDVSYGLLYLHTSNPPIIHRDLTAPNILLTKGLRAKIADLGVSKLLSTRSVSAHTQTKGPGQILYMPPEALLENPKYDSKLDVFSFGHLAIFVSSQQFPKVYEVTTRHAVLAMERGNLQILKRQKSLDAVGQDHYLYPLIRQCLMDDPERRPSTDDLNKSLVQFESKSSEVELSYCQQLKIARTAIVHLKEHSKEQSSLSAENTELRSTLGHLRKERDNALSLLEDEKKRCKVAHKELKELHTQLEVTRTERMESDELKKLDDQLLKLRGENASLEKNVQSMAEECKEAHKELKELQTQLEVTRTEAAIYGEDFATERRDREKAHATVEKLKEQFATDLVLLTEQNRSLILELEAYQQGNLKEASALTQERETAQCHLSADLKEAHSEVQAKNVQVRKYRKQVDSLTSQVSELDRHNTDLIQELSKVRDEVVRLKKSKPRKREKAAPLSEKLSELEFLYDNSCKEIKVLKDTKRALSGLNVELTNGNKKLTAEIQKLTDENQKLERETRLMCDSTPEESAEQEQIRHQLKENFELQEAHMRRMLDKGLNDNKFEASVGNFASLPPPPIRQPQQRQQALVYENYTNTQPSSSGTSPLEPPNPLETTPGPMIQPHNLPQGYTPVSQPFSTALQTQTQSSPIPPLIVSQQEETQSEANQSPVCYQSAPARIGPSFQQNIATTQDNPMTYPILTNDIKAAPNQQKGVLPFLKPLPESSAEQRINQEIQEVAADVVELTGDKRAKEVTNVNAPFDPNLICPMCMKPFRIGEIQKFRKHALDCKGSSAN